MSLSNKLVLLVCFAFSGCTFSYMNSTFGEKDVKNASLYQALIKEANQAEERKGFGKPIAIHGFSKISIYKSAFSGKRIPNQGVLDYAILNKYSNRSAEAIDYKVGIPQGQDAYIIHLQTEPEKKDVFMYLALKYDSKITYDEDSDEYALAQRSTGVSACYFGEFAPRSRDIIQWTDVLKVKKGENGKYFLKDVSNTSLAYRLTDTFNSTDKQLKVRDVILGEKNKIGGRRPLIFNVRNTFGDMDYLHFDYIFTIPNTVQ